MSKFPFGKTPVRKYDPELWDAVRKKMKEENDIFLGGIDIVPLEDFPKWFQDYAKGFKKLTDKYLNR